MLRPSVRIQGKILWSVLAAIAAAGILETSGILGTENFAENWFFTHVVLLLPLLAFGVHGWWTIGGRRTFLFFLISAGIGLMVESLGVRNGVLFGGSYQYVRGIPSITDIPILIPLYWCIFTYTCHMLISSIFLWQPTARTFFVKHRILTPVLMVLLEALAVVSIDMVMDPLMVQAGNWTWSAGGIYAGIPAGNFLGWFLVSCLICGVFHLIAPFRSNREATQTYPPGFLLFPVLGYALLGITLGIDAVRIGLYLPALTGLLTMMPWPVISLVSYQKYIRQRSQGR
ncbi:hypothetical protein AUK40_04495 [Candidatus Wirthbacteria bacterium CG2_30_54_11]|uniref:Carotenoid biosynthesis protein n=1 Tax=Candidatus Wirthbacteria bacterium CG2_30_54_11 TaxID=1817892 RepID=A0A1J5IR56_9BACT|nr:MAG: hypothetical protein AUK40_04495 [Candidatus Wirthbacteria bacterium CG2_30_54_11]